MLNILKVIIIIFAVAFVVIIEYLIRKGNIKEVKTYSYKTVILTGARIFVFVLIICISIYIYLNDLELALTIGIIALVFIIAGCLRSLLIEKRIKERGGHKR